MAEHTEELYQSLLDAGMNEKEIEKHVREKSIEYQGFMTKQAILYLIAKEQGIQVDPIKETMSLGDYIEDKIDYNDFLIPISKIVEGAQNIVIAGKISSIFGIRDFVRKDGSTGRVGTFQICDQSDCIKVILWGEQVKFMENHCFQKGEFIQIIGGYSKKDMNENLEVHLSRQGKVILAPENIKLTKTKQCESNKTTKKNTSKKSTIHSIQDLYEKEGFIRFISGTIQIDEFKELTLKNGEKSFLLKLILTDKTSSIRVNIWGIKAVECVKLINDGDAVKLLNVVIKENNYSNEKELSFTKSSRLEII